jgi:signal peptidase I
MRRTQSAREDDDAGDPAVIFWIEAIRRACFALAFVLSLAQQAFLTSYRVAGSSMTPSFLDGDRVIVSQTPGFFGEPRRGEAIIARVHGEVVIKRIVGVPGDTVALGKGILWCNGGVADDAIPASFHDEAELAPVTLGSDEFFLLGDHRRVSIDSREFGPIRRDAILGRVILRVPQQGPMFMTGALARH